MTLKLSQHLLPLLLRLPFYSVAVFTFFFKSVQIEAPRILNYPFTCTFFGTFASLRTNENQLQPHALCQLNSR